MVANEPSLKEKAREIADLFTGCDFAGYNILKFDVPLLVEEFLRNGITIIPFDGSKFIDCLILWYKKETRTLSDAVRYFAGESHDNDHIAMDDVEATIKVLNGQVSKYIDLQNDVENIDTFTRGGAEVIDYAGKFARNESGELIFTFGDNKGKPVLNNLGMLDWMQPRDFFTEHTKYIA